MIRTNVVKLSSIPALAYRIKQKDGDTGIVIVKPETSQPGIATVSKKTGKPVLLPNIDEKEYPVDAFAEAMKLTNGMPFKKQGSIKVTKEMVEVPVEEPQTEAAAEDIIEVIVDDEAYQKIIDHYTDKNGKLSYPLLNKEMIQFAKRSSTVKEMIGAGCKTAEIRNYVVYKKFRTIADLRRMSDAEVAKIVELIDATNPKGVFKDLDREIKNMQGRAKK